MNKHKILLKNEEFHNKSNIHTIGINIYMNWKGTYQMHSTLSCLVDSTKSRSITIIHKLEKKT